MEHIFYYIIGGAVIMASLIIFEPKFDRNTETGRIIFWFNDFKHNRKFIQL